MSRLTKERIAAVVDAHHLDKEEADAATSAASHIINMFVEWNMSPESVAGVMELLAHLRHDRCAAKPTQSGENREPFEIFTEAVAETGRNGLTKSELLPTLLDFSAAIAIALGGEEALVNCMIRFGDRIKDFREGTFPVDDAT
jgi:hypothetical protein